jgi:hypothetical protein
VMRRVLFNLKLFALYSVFLPNSHTLFCEFYQVKEDLFTK